MCLCGGKAGRGREGQGQKINYKVTELREGVGLYSCHQAGKLELSWLEHSGELTNIWIIQNFLIK